MIQRHLLCEFDLKMINDDYVSNMDTVNVILKKEFKDPYFITSLTDVYFRLSILELFIINDKNKALDFLYKSNNCNNALYNLANNVGHEVYIDYDGLPKITLIGQVWFRHIVPWNFIDHIKLSMLIRKKDYIEEILKFNITSFDPGKVGLSSDEYHIKYVKIIKSFLKKDKSNDLLLKEINDFINYLKDWCGLPPVN